MKKFFTLLLCILTFSVIFITAAYADSSSVSRIDVNSSGRHSSSMTAGISTRRWASVVGSYIYEDSDSTFSILDASGGTINVDTYRKSDYKLLSSKDIKFELNIFGGFYYGSQYNFIVFGQNNLTCCDKCITFKTVKYSRDWTKLGEVNYSCNNTTYPFDAGSLRMVEHNGYLYVHTSHEMYNGHQANLSYNINIDKMMIVDEASAVSYLTFAYTSHSFNQFILIDNGKLVSVDHGDAYPRSIVLNKSNSDLSGGRFVPRDNNEYWTGKRSVDSVDLFTIPGAIGANCTGVTVGGFEASKNNYIVAINTIDHSKVTEYTSFVMTGLDRDERDIVLLISPKNNKDSSKVSHVYLTDYVDNNKLGSTPYLYKISSTRFIVFWEEFEYNSSGSTKSNGLKYVFVDENGQKQSDIRSYSNLHLSGDCQPTNIGGKIMWYINKGNTARTIYILDTNHVHTFSSAWTKNSLKHWHSATCGDTDERLNYGDHVYDDSKDMTCDICGYVRSAVQAQTFQVTYSANNGSGAPEPQIKSYDVSLKLSTVKPTLFGHTFMGWSTTRNGSVEYKAGQVYTKNESVVLYAVWQLNTYTVTYSANYGTGTPHSQIKTHGKPLTLTDERPTRTGYTFMGWSSSRDGNVLYKPGGTYYLDESIVLYAIWSKKETEPDTQTKVYTITYSANHGSGAPGAQEKKQDVALTLSSVKPVRTGHTFLGWSTLRDGAVEYKSGAKYTENKSITLYAVWKIDTYNVFFSANHGYNAPSSQIKTYGVALTLTSDIPSRDGYTFIGWSSSRDGNVEYKPGGKYTANSGITLYAVWQKITVPDYIPGDISNDGKVDSTDAVILAQYLAKWSVSINEKAADCHPDGIINSMDSVLLAQYLAKWNVTLG